MPTGPGTYGSQKGRPKKKKRKSNTKMRLKKRVFNHGNQNQGDTGEDYTIDDSGE
tara:strand:- start:1998 stop:2162 length:165 start_codon:yes stop_codon:yes gene_type:complete